MNIPQFQKFLQTSKVMRTHLDIGGMPLEAKTHPNYQFYSPKILLPPVFSHMNCLVIQALAETGHGEFRVKIEKKNHEYVVYLNSHISQRYFLSQKDSEMMQKAYQQIITSWDSWWRSSDRI
jgi:hypothetical protein